MSTPGHEGSRKRESCALAHGLQPAWRELRPERFAQFLRGVAPKVALRCRLGAPAARYAEVMRRHAPMFVAAAALVLTGCAAGDPQFTVEDPAGFWHGLWHGMISFITLIIGIFSDSVGVYEIANTGGWYDFGFLIGATAIWGGGSSRYHHQRRKTQRDKEWEELAQKAERKIRRKIRQWAEAEPDDDWDLVEVKAEEKFKRKVREWADDDA